MFIDLIFIFFSNTSHALEKGRWIFVKDDEYCYIGSIPIETDLPKEKKRGETFSILKKQIRSSLEKKFNENNQGKNINSISEESTSYDKYDK